MAKSTYSEVTIKVDLILRCKIFGKLMNKFVVLTGHRKSGTTLLHRLFDGCKEMALYPVDLSVLYAYFPCMSQSEKSSDVLRQRLLHVVRKSIGELGDGISNEDALTYFRKLDEAIDDKDLLKKDIVIKNMLEIWRILLGMSSGSLYAFKETSQSFYIEKYMQWFDEIKMVSVVRDPRDNYAAIKDGVRGYYSKFGESELISFSSFVNRARFDLQSAMINQANHPENFMAIKFEDLVADTENIMRDVSDFIGISFTDDMLTPTSLGLSYDGNCHDGHKIVGVSSENVGRWIDRINEDEAKIIEYLMSDLMAVWGYESHYGSASSQLAFTKFYEQYNCEYFFNDSFN